MKTSTEGPDTLLRPIGDTLAGCLLVVEQVTKNVHKYEKDQIWTKAESAMFGQGDMVKLRTSLETYKLALSLGLAAGTTYNVLGHMHFIYIYLTNI